jgi:type IV fimbrial biogenesis protein FimT
VVTGAILLDFGYATNMKNRLGFTLIELLITIVVLAVLLTLAAPSFRDVIQNNRVTAQANELVSALHLARAEAVKRGQNAQVRVRPAGQGWAATVSVADTDLREIDRAESGVSLFGLSDPVSDAVTVVFAPTGVPATDASFDLQVNRCNAQQRRRVDVGVTGHVTSSRQDCL